MTLEIRKKKSYLEIHTQNSQTLFLLQIEAGDCGRNPPLRSKKETENETPAESTASYLCTMCLSRRSHAQPTTQSFMAHLQARFTHLQAFWHWCPWGGPHSPAGTAGWPSTIWMGRLWAACATSESGGNVAVLSSSETACSRLHSPFPLLKYTTRMWCVTPQPHAAPPDPNAYEILWRDTHFFVSVCEYYHPVSTSRAEPWSPGLSLPLSIIRNTDKTTTSDKLDLTLRCWWIIRVHLPVLITVMAHRGW